jgi:hypothetical protein
LTVSKRRMATSLLTSTTILTTVMLFFMMLTIVSAMASQSMMEDFSAFLTADIMETLTNVVNLFDPRTLGRMDSQIYRRLVEMIQVSSGITRKTLCLMILFSSFIKNRERLMQAIDSTPTLKANPDVAVVRSFLSNNCTTS